MQKYGAEYKKRKDVEARRIMAELVGTKAQDSSSCLTCGKPAKGGEHFCSAACEEQWIAKKFPRDYADMKKRDGRLTDSSSRRERLHRALDHVLGARDAGKAKDVGGKTAYVKNRLYADKVSSDMDHNVGGEWLNPGKELSSFDASDKGVFFKDIYGTIYHVDFSDCNKNLSARKPR
jgi:hypothetical protein